MPQTAEAFLAKHRPAAEEQRPLTADAFLAKHRPEPEPAQVYGGEWGDEARPEPAPAEPTPAESDPREMLRGTYERAMQAGLYDHAAKVRQQLEELEEPKREVLTGQRFFKGARKVVGGMLAAPGRGLSLAPSLGEHLGEELGAPRLGKFAGRLAQTAGYFGTSGLPMLGGEIAGSVIEGGPEAGESAKGGITTAVLIGASKIAEKKVPGIGKLLKGLYTAPAAWDAFRQAQAEGKSTLEAIGDAATIIAADVVAHKAVGTARRLETPRGKVPVKVKEVKPRTAEEIGKAIQRKVSEVGARPGSPLEAAAAKAVTAAPPKATERRVWLEAPPLEARLGARREARYEPKVAERKAERIGERKAFRRARAERILRETTLKGKEPLPPEQMERLAKELGRIEARQAGPKIEKVPTRAPPEPLSAKGMRAREAHIEAEASVKRFEARHPELAEPAFGPPVRVPAKAPPTRKVPPGGVLGQPGKRAAVPGELTPAQIRKHFKKDPRRAATYDTKTDKIYLRPDHPWKKLTPSLSTTDILEYTREGTAAHEVGHRVYRKMPAQMRRQWNEYVRGEPRFLDHSPHAIAEEFSRAYAMARVIPQRLRPEVKAYFDSHKSGMEQVAPGTVVRVSVPAGPPGYPEVQAKVPPGMPGGVIGQPTPRKTLAAIHATRRDLGLPEKQFRGLVSEATGGRTESTKALTRAESKSLLGTIRGSKKAQRRIKIAEAAPADVKLMARRRRPADTELAEVEALQKAAPQEVKARRGTKYPITPGEIRKPGLWRRFKESGVGQFLGLGNLNPETQVYQAVGDKGKTHKALYEDRAMGQDKAHAIQNAAHDRLGETFTQRGIKFKDVRRWTTAVGGRKWGKLEKVQLPSGQRLKLTPDMYAELYGMSLDPVLAAGMARQGVHIAGGTVRFGGAEFRAIRRHLLSNHPKLEALVHDFAMEYNGPIRDMFVTTYWKDTGEPLKVRKRYWPSERHKPGVRREQVERAGPMGQQQQWAHELARNMRTKGLGKAPKPGVGLPEQAAAYRSPGELRGIPPLKPQIGGEAPYELRGMFNRYLSHVNRASAYVGKALPAQKADLVLWNPEFRKAMTEGFADGKARLRELERLSQAYKGLEVESTTALDRFVSGALRRASMGVLGGKLQIPLYQPLSYLNAMSVIPAKHLFAPSTLRSKGAMAEIKKHGATFRARFEGSAHMIMSPALAEPGTAAARRFYGGRRGIVETAALGPLHYMDQLTMVRLWTASKRWAKADGFTGDKLMIETNRRAITAAARSQPTWDVMSIAPLQREARKSPWKKPFVMFTSQANKNVNQAVRAYDAWRHGEIGAARFARDAGIPILINGAGVYFIGTGVKAGAAAAFGKKARERSLVEHLAGVTDRALGGWLYAGSILPDLVRLVNAEMGGRARFFTKRNMLTQIPEDAWRVVRIATDIIVDKAKGKEPPEGKRAKQFLQALRSGAVLTGLPVGGAEQLLRPALKEEPLGRRGRRRGRR